MYFARLNNHWGILNEYGKVLVPFLYDYVFYESEKIIANIGGGAMENTVLGKHVYGGRWGYVDLNAPIPIIKLPIRRINFQHLENMNFISCQPIFITLPNNENIFLIVSHNKLIS